MAPKIAPWAFVLAVPDLERSAAYYREVLGFGVLWEEASEWRLVERDGVRVMLGHCPKDMQPSELGSHNWFGYLEVDDVDALHVEIAGRGATCSSPKDSMKTAARSGPVSDLISSFANCFGVRDIGYAG